MNNRIYVGNLPYGVGDDELKEIFAAHGTVTDVRVISDAVSGRSKGFGFVEMENEDQAKVAIEQMDGSDCQGRSLRVAQARPPRERSDREPRSYN